MRKPLTALSCLWLIIPLAQGSVRASEIVAVSGEPMDAGPASRSGCPSFQRAEYVAPPAPRAAPKLVQEPAPKPSAPPQTRQGAQQPGAHGQPAEYAAAPPAHTIAPVPAEGMHCGTDSGPGVVSGVSQAMIGDLVGAAFACRVLGGVRFCDPIVEHGPYKIAECESPLPQDRVYFNFNFYDDVRTLGVLGVTPKSDVYRETFGLEKAFGDGAFSIGVRAPLIQNDAPAGINVDDFGDMTLILKFAPIHDCQEGRVLATGLAVTVPTGPGIFVSDGTTSRTLHDTILQPWVGAALAAGDTGLYVTGFSSVAIPTDSEDVTFWFNDLGVGYVIDTGGLSTWITAVTPTVEAHVNTPLDHKNSDSLILGINLVDLVAGVHVTLKQDCTFTLGAATSLSGPRPYDVEMIAQLAMHY
jgi:hypothetical protein